MSPSVVTRTSVSSGVRSRVGQQLLNRFEKIRPQKVRGPVALESQLLDESGIDVSAEPEGEDAGVAAQTSRARGDRRRIALSDRGRAVRHE